jgi:hypothetical protein
MWKTLRAGQAIDDNKIWRICFTCWITTDYKHKLQTDTLIIFNNAYPWQQWLRERASMLRYTYIVCRVAYFKATQKVYFYILLIIFYFITISIYYCIITTVHYRQPVPVAARLLRL